jgi:hypothetical protein
MSTPLKHYGSSSDSFTPSTNTRSSTYDFASPSTQLTNYSPELVRKADNGLGGLLNSLSINATTSQDLLEDPFVDDHNEASAFSLRATAVDYAPLTATGQAPTTAQSLAHSSSSPSTIASSHPVKPIVGGVVNVTPPSATRYVKIIGPADDVAGMTRIKDVSSS